jgi:hypothetical protein
LSGAVDALLAAARAHEHDAKEGTRGEDQTNMPSSTSDAHSKVKPSQELRAFLKNVHQKIPQPLIMLLKLIPTNKSLQTRITGVEHLCESLLVSTKCSWDTKVDDMDGNSNSNGNIGENDMTEIGAELNPSENVAELKSSAIECVIIMSVEENGEC